MLTKIFCKLCVELASFCFAIRCMPRFAFRANKSISIENIVEMRKKVERENEEELLPTLVHCLIYVIKESYKLQESP